MTEFRVIMSVDSKELFRKLTEEVYPGMLEKAKKCLNDKLMAEWNAGEDCDVSDEVKWKYIFNKFKSYCSNSPQAIDWYIMGPEDYKKKYYPKS